jgi:hypothetical protein
MSWRTTAVLFAILVILGGYVYWQNQQEPQATPVPTPAFGAVAEPVALMSGGVSIDDVRRLDLQRREDGATASFSRDDEGEWAQTTPTQTVVISYTMDSLAGSLTNLTSRRALPAGDNPLSAYGLENPAHQIDLVVEQPGGATVRHTLLVGDDTPGGDSVYVQKQGDRRIFVVAKYLLDNIIRVMDEPPVFEPEAEEEPLPPVIPLPPAEPTPAATEEP